MIPDMRRLLIDAARLAGSVALIWFAFSRIDTARAFELLGSIPLGIVASVIAVLALQIFVAAIRVHRLLALNRSPVSLLLATDSVFVGIFFSQTLISFIGGDAMRVWRLTVAGIRLPDALNTVLLDRIVGFAGLIVLIAIEAPLLLVMVSAPAMTASIAVTLILGIGGLAAVFMVDRLPDSLLRWRVCRVAAGVSSLAKSISRNGIELAYLLGLSVVVQVTNVVAIYLIAHGLHSPIGFLELLVLVPPVMLLAMLPISVAGWGVREGAMAAALGLIGVSAEQSVAMSVCFGLCFIVAGLPGGITWLVARKTKGNKVGQAGGGEKAGRAE